VVVEIKANYLRIRIKEPSLFVKGTFRTKSIGKTGGVKMIVGRLKRSNTWNTQSYIFSINTIISNKTSTMKALHYVTDNLSSANKTKVYELIDYLQKGAYQWKTK